MKYYFFSVLIFIGCDRNHVSNTIIDNKAEDSTIVSVVREPVLPKKDIPIFTGARSGGNGSSRKKDLINAADWPRWGQNLTNNHHNRQSKISKEDLERLSLKCTINYRRGLLTTTTGSISQQPIIVKDVLYWTGFGGQVGAAKLVRDTNGEIARCDDIWVQDISNLLSLGVETSEPNTRVSPAFYHTQDGRGALLFTAIASSFSLPGPVEALNTPIYAFALDAKSGHKLFQIIVADAGVTNPDNAFAITTSSPIVHEGIAYFGISSFNNVFSSFGYPITFRGQIFALDLNKKVPELKWKQYVLPAKPDTIGVNEPWFAGGGVWASGASILPNAGKDNKGLIFFGSGQLYNAPLFTQSCMNETVISQNFNGFIADQKGETGAGALECYEQSTKELINTYGINHPIASNSIIALNIADGSFAWHVPTNGIDTWQLACGVDINPSIGCSVEVPGPDWDVGGSNPILIEVDGEHRILSHNKGGQLFQINALTGQIIMRADVCVGTISGGIHWGLSYDSINQQILAPCSGGQFPGNNGFGEPELVRSILADGTEICARGYLNAMDVRTGNLLWQAVAPEAASLVRVCPSSDYQVDIRFKSGIAFDVVTKNIIDPNVNVIYMPFDSNIPLKLPEKSRMHSPVSIAGGMIFMPVYHGSTYIIDAITGTYLKQLHCTQGAQYQGTSVTDDIVSFGCGYGSFGGEADVGDSIMVFGVPKKSRDFIN
jgi:hypothetical protein